MDATAYVRKIAAAARSAAARLAVGPASQRNAALRSCAKALRERADDLKAANAKDIAAAKQAHLDEAMIDRLSLTDERIEAMAAGLEAIAARADFLGQAITTYNRPDGLRIEKRRVPLGVVAIIYESRPNVTADAAGLCLKSGNACILRGGKEAVGSNLAIARCLHAGLAEAALPAAAVTVIESTDHAVVPALARAEGLIDLIVPRGGQGLIRTVVEAATIPVIKHYAGNCHVYVHADADLAMAEKIVMNAKCQRPGVCNAMETLLVDAAVAEAFLPGICQKLAEAGVELRCDQRCRKLYADTAEATEEDWRTEYLSLMLAVRVVDSLDQAIEHINTFGSGHTDAIITNNTSAAEQFVAGVDSSSVMVNASTRLSDGGEYGLGAEVGISTDKLHARGPMGAEDLTTYKWVVTGRGHIRQ
ncbi:MAG: gamma-glutamyl phosphate reductase [Phycisphaerae bacterium SM23_33]|nr:MAG: gamma-glutamyl phosphate reductase [Phycisphaerae bacterium SM23_33]